jgi:hypothetical protein
MNQDTFENKIIPWIGTLWFLVSINSFFLWFAFGRIIRYIAFLGMLYASLMLSKKFKATIYNLPIFLSLLFYFLWSLGFIDNQYALIIKILNFIPLFLLLFWPKNVFNNCYEILRKVIIFFAIGSSIVSVLSFVGVLEYLPHFTFEGRSALHQSRGIVYYVYGAFVTLHSVSAGISSRACGPLQEPGHWGIILGLFYLIDWYALKKRNIWIIICGILTFSSGFWAMFLFVEIFNLFSKKAFGKTILYMSTIIIALFIILLLLPQNTKDDVTYLLFGRNLENVYENFEETGSLDDALDVRASNFSLNRYNNLRFDEYLFGTGYRDTSAALSDYRGTILYMGLIGFILSIIPSFLIIRRANWRLAISLFLSLFLIYLHRGWMLFSSYIYFLAFLAVTLSTMPRVETDKYLAKQE